MCDKFDVAGMTVNERLFHFGLFEEFDAAVRARSKEAVIDVLLRTSLSRVQAEETTMAVLADPNGYGH